METIVTVAGWSKIVVVSQWIDLSLLADVPKLIF